ncbi:NUDIX hydrolase [Oceanobacillus massiliensis]|uniref:NUDIX hydrolase n=1 Tax=Oceanobacillus massiliensis TaxID=1465765 RepID=UPI003017FC8A
MELWDLYDCNRKKLGKTHRRGVPVPEGCYHLVVHAWIQNSKGEILLSKRHPNKHYGGLWECAGGSVLAGESSLEGVIRETREELGLEIDPDSLSLLYRHLKPTYHSDYWLAYSNADIASLNLQDTEVIAAKWVDRHTYYRMIRNGEIVPTLPDFYKLLSD